MSNFSEQQMREVSSFMVSLNLHECDMRNALLNQDADAMEKAFKDMRGDLDHVDLWLHGGQCASISEHGNPKCRETCPVQNCQACGEGAILKMGRWNVQQHDTALNIYVVWLDAFKFAIYDAESDRTRFKQGDISSENLAAYCTFLNFLRKWHTERIANYPGDIWSTNGEHCGPQIDCRWTDFLAYNDKGTVQLYWKKRRIGSFMPNQAILDLSGLEGTALTLATWNNFETFLDMVRMADWKGDQR